MQLDLNDLFVFGGMTMTAGGVGYEFGPAWAAIVVGVQFFILGYWSA